MIELFRGEDLKQLLAPSSPSIIARTSLATPENGTMRSADAPPGVKARPGGARKS